MFDAAASRKWGICWSERLKCTRYMYVGKHYKLFEEVPSNIRGRRSGKPNVGLQLGLMSTPISNYGACRLFVNTDIIPPTYSAMRKQSNKISQAMVALNAKNMHEIRDTIARENELCYVVIKIVTKFVSKVTRAIITHSSIPTVRHSKLVQLSRRQCTKTIPAINK